MIIQKTQLSTRMRIRDVATYIPMSVSSIDKMLAQGEFVQPDYLVGTGKIRMWEISTINEWLNSQRNPKKDIAA